MTRTAIRNLAAALAIAGAAAVVGDAYLAAKGVLARTLIARATEATLVDGGDHRPWPWADFRPLALLEVPRLGVQRPILSGAGGAVLAFGLGHVDGTAAPGGTGLSVVGGHRDGDARFLVRLEPGDRVRVRTATGDSGWRVRGARVLQADAPVRDPGPGDRIWLVTCWPIDAVRPGPSRYVVELFRE